ncbi:hypothetical protein [Leucobacter japonicus]|uniref:hypothetical protein n=1 Tax=Leucobacter japonicus TaxID=1461259 RepID=UPI0006A7C9A5|nr:hypothetical protein [Leucobacter japonicus]
MPEIGPTVIAKRTRWLVGGVKQPVIRIDSGNHFVIVPYENARKLVDAVHDLCDEHERRER